MINFDKYSKEFMKLAFSCQRDDEFIANCLSYAGHLNDKNLPIIYDQAHFSLLVGYKDSYVLSVSNSSSNFYTKFLLPKKNGGTREIHSPYPSLKEIQHWILNNILNNLNVSKFAKAYVPNSSIKGNVRFHRKQKCVLKLDIKHFFPSIKFKNIYEIFTLAGYIKPVSVLLANICTLNGSLPQGAPTSPALSNLFFNQIDKRIAGFSKQRGLRYTRYADDLTFSGDLNSGEIIYFIGKILHEYDLKLNFNKIRLMHPHNRQIVTGVVVNKTMNAPKALRRKLIQEAYYINKFGLSSHQSRKSPFTQNYIEKILGQAYFVRFINPHTPKIDWIIEVFKKAKANFQAL